MKKLFFLTILIALIGLEYTYAQCDKKKMQEFAKYVCENDNVYYLRIFIKEINKKDGKIVLKNKWQVALNKGIKYRFYMYGEPSYENYIMALFQKARTIPLESTFHGGKYTNYFDFTCNQTGTYYLKIQGKGANKLTSQSCYGGVLTFVNVTK